VYVCADTASNFAVSDPDKARKRRRASCGIAAAGIIVTAIVVVTAVLVDLKACIYVIKGVCYRIRDPTRYCTDKGVIVDGWCYSNAF